MFRRKSSLNVFFVFLFFTSNQRERFNNNYSDCDSYHSMEKTTNPNYTVSKPEEKRPYFSKDCDLEQLEANQVNYVLSTEP